MIVDDKMIFIKTKTIKYVTDRYVFFSVQSWHLEISTCECKKSV